MVGGRAFVVGPSPGAFKNGYRRKREGTNTKKKRGGGGRTGQQGGVEGIKGKKREKKKKKCPRNPRTGGGKSFRAGKKCPSGFRV